MARVLKDKRVLKLVRADLNRDGMVNGVVMEMEEGIPRGGSLSPLLSNIRLNDWDRRVRCREAVLGERGWAVYNRQQTVSMMRVPWLVNLDGECVHGNS